MMRVLSWPDGEYQRVRLISGHSTYQGAFEVAVREVAMALVDLERCSDVLATVEPVLSEEGVCLDSRRSLLEWLLHVTECRDARPRLS